MQNFDHNIGFWVKRQLFRWKLSKIAENCNHNIDPRSTNIMIVHRSTRLYKIRTLQHGTWSRGFTLCSPNDFICPARQITGLKQSQAWTKSGGNWQKWLFSCPDLTAGLAVHCVHNPRKGSKHAIRGFLITENLKGIHLVLPCIRVTRLGEFSTMGGLYSLDNFILKAQILLF
jgi:hypothetical protein